MKFHAVLRPLLAMLAATLLTTGCGQPPKNGAQDERAETHEEGDAHEHDQESPSGASFKAGKGVMLTDETRNSLGVEVVDVVERKLAAEVRFTAQIFGERHHHLPNLADHSGCDVHGSGFVADEIAATTRKGDPVQILVGTNAPLSGTVLGVQKAIALGESELIVGISNAISILHPGEFVPASIVHPQEDAVAAVPQAALLRTSEGTFVYAVNGSAYFRTAVRTAAESDGWVAISDGLLAGDQVVVKPVKTLWLIELRATKGGGHSH